MRKALASFKVVSIYSSVNLFKLVSAIFFLSLNPSFVSAQNCVLGLQISYPDGEKGCLTDLAVSNIRDKAWAKPIHEVAKYAGYYSISASTSCKHTVIGVGPRTNIGSSFISKIQAESNALSQCPTNCECAIVIDNGNVLLPKSSISLIGLNNSSLATDLSSKGILIDSARATSEAENKAKLAAAEKARLETEAVRLAKEKQESIRLALEKSKNEDEVRLKILKEQSDRQAQENAKLIAEVEKLKQQLSKSETIQVAVGNRKALVFGNNNYKNIAKLENALEDAKVIAQNLAQVGYSVTLKTDLTEKEMKAAIRIFKGQVNAGDEVAIFYAGHGVQLGSTNYLLPVDVGGDNEEQVKDEGVPLQRLLDDMTERKAKFTLTVLDACRDNPFKVSGRSIGGGTRGLAPTSAATGQMVVFSAGNGQQALDKLGLSDKNKNGVFTRTFIKEMQKPGLTIDRIVKNVRNEVAELAKSVGHEQVPAIYDQVLGDFYFKPK